MNYSGEGFMDNVPFKIDESIISSVAQAVSKIQQSLETNPKSVTDEFFRARLEKALEKNFAYIERKDAAQARALLNGTNNAHVNVPPPPRPPAFIGNVPNRLGLGSTAASAAPVEAQETGKRGAASVTVGAESASIYISKLPTDITEEELEILFGALGRIKKVKLYTTPLGQRKGDALLTFAQPEHAASACYKFNGLDIGEGHVISVVRAEFGGSSNNQNSSSSSSSSKNNNGTALTSTALIPVASTGASNRNNSGGNNNTASSSSSIAALCAMLPADTEAGRHPVALVMNAFDPARGASDEHSDFFDELEADMLLECCKFGKVRGIQLLTLPGAFMTGLQSVPTQAGRPAPVLGMAAAGTIAVTFAEESVARRCAVAMDGRKFDGRLLATHVLPSLTQQQSPALPGSLLSGFTAASAVTAAAIAVPPPPRPPVVPKPVSMQQGVIVTSVESAKEESLIEQVDVEAISSSVDDFLSSLL